MLNFTQRSALAALTSLNDWASVYDFNNEFSGHTFNSLVRKGLVEKRQKPGWSAITQFKVLSRAE
jgi:hypothetical protein